MDNKERKVATLLKFIVEDYTSNYTNRFVSFIFCVGYRLQAGKLDEIIHGWHPLFLIIRMYYLSFI